MVSSSFLRRFFHTIYAHPFISLFHILPLLILLPASFFFFWQEAVVPLFPLLLRAYHYLGFNSFLSFLTFFLFGLCLLVLFSFPFLASYAFVDQRDFREGAWNNSPSRAFFLLYSSFFWLFRVLFFTHMFRFYYHLHGQNIWDVIYSNGETVAVSILIPGFLWLCVKSLPIAETDLVSEYNYDDSNWELEAVDMVFGDEQDRIIGTIMTRLNTEEVLHQHKGDWRGKETTQAYLFKDLWTHCSQDWVGDQRISLWSSPLKGERYFHPPLRPWFAGGTRDGEFDPLYEAVMVATGLHPHVRPYTKVIKVRFGWRPPIPQGLTIDDDFRLYASPVDFKPDERTAYLIENKLTRIYDPALAEIFPLGAG